MPRLWTATVESHRREVRDAVIDAGAGLVAERGLRGVTMSDVARTAGIGRATLYKYFADVEAILLAWHERQIRHHVKLLRAARDRPGSPLDRLRAVLEAYAHAAYRSRRHGAGEIAHALHRDQHVTAAEREVRELVRGLLAEGARAGDVTTDVPSSELASYCINALGAAAELRSNAAVRRLVSTTLAGVRAGS